MTQEVLQFENREDFSKDSFLVSDSNREAYLWMEKWPDWPSHCLIIYGPNSCGKSHLASIWSEDSGAANDSLTLFQRERGRECIIIDPLENINEEELFHLFNYKKETKGYLLLTSKLHPSKLDITLPDLRSRLNGAISIAMHEPDDELLKAVLQKHFSDRQLKVSNEVVEFLASRIERSFQAASKIVETIDQKSMEEKRNITIPFVRHQLFS